MVTKKDNQKSNKPTAAKGGGLELQSKSAKPVKNEKKVVSEVRASVRYIRIAPRKIRLVIQNLNGQNALAVIDQLRFVQKAAAKPVIKLINSALANAENNFRLDKKDLYLKKIVANEGSTLKRWQPKAHGRATPIRKRSSHLELVLGLKPGAKELPVRRTAVSQKDAAKETKDRKEEVKVVRPEEVKRSAPKIAGQSSSDKSHEEKERGFVNKIFNRKTG